MLIDSKEESIIEFKMTRSRVQGRLEINLLYLNLGFKELIGLIQLLISNSLEEFLLKKLLPNFLLFNMFWAIELLTAEII